MQRKRTFSIIKMLRRTSLSFQFTALSLLMVTLSTILVVYLFLGSLSGEHLMIYFMVVVFTGAVAFVLASMVTSPLKEIIAALNDYRKFGTLREFKNYQGHDIQMLSETFQNLISEMEQRNIECQKSDKLNKDILDNTVDGIVVINEVGTVVTFNKAAELVFGYRSEEVLGQNVNMLMPHEVAKRHDYYLKRYHDSGEPRIVGVGAREMEALNKKGKVVPIEISVSETWAGNGKLFTAVVRNIAEKKAFEEKLRKARTKAEKASEVKGYFLASMTHEIRTPLNAILGYAQLLEEDFKIYGHKQYLKDIESIRNVGTHLLSLITDVLDFAKIESGETKLFLSNIDVSELLDEVEDLVTPLFDYNKNDLSMHMDKKIRVIRGDRDKLKQILINLLNNANKFTDQGRIKLSVIKTEIDGKESVKFQVEDDGIGMSSEDVNHIFEPFVQAYNTQGKKRTGTGLGLSICQQFCQLMHGKIDVASKIGVGSTFSVNLPLEGTEPKPKFGEGAKKSGIVH